MDTPATAAVPDIQPVAFTSQADPDTCVKCGSPMLVGFYVGDGDPQKNVFPEQAALTKKQAETAIEAHDNKREVVEFREGGAYCHYGCKQELSPAQVRLRDMAADVNFMGWVRRYNPNAERDIGPSILLLMWDSWHGALGVVMNAQNGLHSEADINAALSHTLEKAGVKQSQYETLGQEFWAHMDDRVQP